METSNTNMAAVVEERETTATSTLEEPRSPARNENVQVTASQRLILEPVPSQEARDVTAQSDLARLDRRIVIVTTAGLPWRTGTAVNPLLRALYLTRGRPQQYITLLIPWLASTEAQQKLYGQVFPDPTAQEAWIRTYCRERCNAVQEEPNLQIKFWEGSYHTGFGSIFPTEDICSLIPENEADVAILEEPEHLNWWRTAPKEKDDKSIENWSWASRFSYVIGVMHTNYAAYMKQYGLGTSLVTAPALNALSALVVRAYCHRLIRLSGTLTSLDKDLEVTCNVHGVRDEFFVRPKNDINDDDAPLSSSSKDDKKLAEVYFIGKVIWAKGFDKLLELQEIYRHVKGSYFPIDIYGGGEDMKAIKLSFLGRRKAREVEKESGTEDLEDDDDIDSDDKAAANIFNATSSLREQVQEVPSECLTPVNEPEPDFSPGDVFADLSGKTFQTGANVVGETANAALNLVESVVQHGIGAFSKKEDDDSEKSPTPNEEIMESPARKKAPFSLAPPLSRFKWRKTPVPARFMGVKDHIDLRELSSQKIFLNMSTTEVLCTYVEIKSL